MGAAWNRGMFKAELRLNLLLLIVSSALLAISSFLWITLSLPIGCLFGYDSPLVVVQSVALFSIFNSIKIGGKVSRVLLEIGDKSFGIYLITYSLSMLHLNLSNLTHFKDFRFWLV